MRALIWTLFFLGAILSWIFFGTAGRIIYLAIVSLLILLFRRQLSIGLTHVASKAGLMKGTIDRMPLSIVLAPAPAHDPAAAPARAELSAEGFLDAGAWSIPGMPQIHLTLMVHPADRFLAAIESADAFGVQVNVHTLYPGSGVITFTNSRLPAPPAQRPGSISMRLPGIAPREVVIQARTDRRREGMLPVTIPDAPSIYARLYEESIRFRKTRGA